MAYLGLGDAWGSSTAYGGNQNEEYSKSSAAARKALELDPTLAHAHAILGANYIEKEWDFAGGEAELKKAIQLDPNDATALQWYGEDIGLLGGRAEESLAELDRAHLVDPGSWIIRSEQGAARILAGQLDAGLELCNKLVAENPGFARAHDCLGKAYEGKHMYAEALAEYKKSAELSGVKADEDTLDVALEGFRAGGWKAATGKAAAFMVTRRNRGEPIMASDIATFYAASGDKEEAFKWLDVAFRERDRGLIGLRTNIGLETLRDDPRFAELVKKVGLP
jgi:tetratricopeptide (TPR) repeat protein